LIAVAVTFGVVQQKTTDNRDRIELNRKLLEMSETRVESRLQRIENKLDALLLEIR